MDPSNIPGLLTTDENGIDANIGRVGKKIDEFFQHIGDTSVPLFSGIEFSITGLCNRKCVFCPRVDPEVYPNKNEHLPLDLYERVLREMAEVGFHGRISFAGFGEPLLHPKIKDLVRMTREILPNVLLEIISNGDRVTPILTKALFEAGLSTLVISMYDGEHQIARFTKIREEAGATDRQMLIRVRYKTPDEGFGLTISNRAGLIDLSKLGIKESPEEAEVKHHHACYYPHYRLMVEQDGDVLLCCHDWTKAFVVGNLHKESVMDVWLGENMHRARKSLGKGMRAGSPCGNCNVLGTRMGAIHFRAWDDFYKRTDPAYSKDK